MVVKFSFNSNSGRINKTGTVNVSGFSSHYVAPVGSVTSFEDRFTTYYANNYDYISASDVAFNIEALQSEVTTTLDGYITDTTLAEYASVTDISSFAGVTEKFGAYVAKDGAAASMWGIDVDANGIIGGIELGALSGITTSQSYFKVAADNFYIYSPNNETMTLGDAITPIPVFSVSTNATTNEVSVNFNGKTVFENLTDGTGATIIDGGRISTEFLSIGQPIGTIADIGKGLGEFTDFAALQAYISDNSTLGLVINFGDTYYDTSTSIVYYFKGGDTSGVTNWVSTEGYSPVEGTDYWINEGNYVETIFSKLSVIDTDDSSFDGTTFIAPTGWFDDPVVSASYDKVYVSKTTWRNDAQAGTWTNNGWSTPTLWSGLPSKSVSVVADSYVVKYSEVTTGTSQTLSPISITLSATVSNIDVSANTYVWYLLDANNTYVEILNEVSSTLVVDSATIAANTTATYMVTIDGADDTITLAGVRDGGDSITVILDNESHSVKASHDGVIYDITSASSNVFVYKGSTDVTTDCTIDLTPTTGLTLATTTGSLIDVTAVADNTISGTVTALVTFDGVTVDRKFSLGVVLDGVPGVDGIDGLEGPQGIPGADGLDGADGVSIAAANVTAEATAYVFTKLKDGTTTPASITITASPYNIDSPTYSWNTTETTASITVVPTDIVLGEASTYTCTVSGGTSDVSDSVSITYIDAAEDAINVIGINQDVTVISDYAGNVTSYTGSGANFEVYSGATKLTLDLADSTPVYPNFYCYVISSTDITAGAFSGSGTTTAIGGDSSGMSTTSNTALITYGIVYGIESGGYAEVTREQIVKKSREGVPGTKMDIVYGRFTTAPTAPTEQVNPPNVNWDTDVSSAPGTGLLYTCYGSSADGSDVWDWSTPSNIEGDVFVEVSVFKDTTAVTAPPTMAYDFSTSTLTTSDGWSTSIPTVSVTGIMGATATVSGYAGNPSATVDTTAWSEPAVVAKAGTSGTSVDIIYGKFLTPPTAPTATSNPPSSDWDTDASTAPGIGTIYSCYGVSASDGGVWYWNTPTPLTGDIFVEVTVFKDTTSTVSPPDMAYDFTTSTLAVADGWTSSVPTVSVGGIMASTATVSSFIGDTSATVVSADWSTPTVAAILAPEGVGKIKATAFSRSATDLTTAPTGGTFSDPVPTEVEWEDGIPAGTAPVWMSTRLFTSTGIGEDAEWSAPSKVSALGDGVRNMFRELTTDAWHITPAVTDLYMNTSTTIDGGLTWSDPVGDGVLIKGEQGLTSYFHIAYSDSSDGSVNFNQTGGVYVGTYVDYVELDSDVYTDYSWSQFIGSDGIPGTNGADGYTSYLHVKYSNDGVDFTADSGNGIGEDVGTYIGTYVDFISADSTTFGDYVWKKFVGDDGKTSFTATVFLQDPAYPIGTPPAAPSGGSLVSGDTTSLVAPTDWTTVQPVTSSDPVWASSYTFTGDTGITLTGGTWSDPVVDAVIGADGNTSIVVELYNDNTLTLPGAVTYTFTTGAVSGELNSWSTTMPPLTIDGVYMTTALFTGNTTASTVDSGDWSAAVQVGTVALDAITTHIGDPAVSIECSLSGLPNVSSPYPDTSTYIEVLEGDVRLDYIHTTDNTTVPSAGTWYIKNVVGTDINVGDISENGDYAMIANATSITTSSKYASITFELSIGRADGSVISRYVYQKITKIFVPVRSALSTTLSITTDSPTDVELDAAIAAAANGNTPIDGDSVIWTSSSAAANPATAIAQFMGGVWAPNLKLYVNGDAIVEGTLFADRLRSRGTTTGFDLDGRVDADGISIAEAGGVSGCNIHGGFIAGTFAQFTTEGGSVTRTVGDGDPGDGTYAIEVLGTGASDSAIYANAFATGTHSYGGYKGVYGDSPNTGVYGRCEVGAGVEGVSKLGGIGVKGTGDIYLVSADPDVYSSGIGVDGYSTYGYGVRGLSYYSTGVYGSSTEAYGVNGVSSTNSGVRGESSTWRGVYGVSADGTGVYGESTNGVAGVSGSCDTTNGVLGTSVSGYGVNGSSSSGRGVNGSSGDSTGVYGYSLNQYGVYGSSSASIGVKGASAGSDSLEDHGVYGVQTNGGIGVHGKGAIGTGGYGDDYDFYAYGLGVNYGPFTGSHDAFINTDVIYDFGDIVSVYEVLFRSSLSNTVSSITPSTSPKEPTVFGVIALIVSLPNSTASAIPDGADLSKLDGMSRVSVNSLGEGQMNICEANGDVLNGDYICSSIVSGKGMKQDDDILHSYTVAKALESTLWANESDGVNGVFTRTGSDDIEYKCKLVACTYHAG